MSCQGITKSGTQCSRKVNSGNCWQHQENILTILPRDIFSNIGTFLDYPEIDISLQSNLPKNLYLSKHCIDLIYDEKTTVNTLIYLQKHSPNLTNIKIYFEDDLLFAPTNMIKELMKFKKLEILEFLPASTSTLNYIFDNLFSKGFPKLKVLRLIAMRTNLSNLHMLCTKTSTLQTLDLFDPESTYDFEPNEEKKENLGLTFPNSLNSLLLNYHEPKKHPKNPNLSYFKHLKRLDLFYLSSAQLINLSEMKNLEVLRIQEDDFEFLNFKNAIYFPEKLKFFYCKYIGYGTNLQSKIFRQLNLQNLEYLSVYNLSSILNIIDLLFSYKNLQHLHVDKFKFNRLNLEVLDQFEMLKKYKPELTFDFEYTRAKTLSNDIIYYDQKGYTHDDEYDYEYINTLQDKIVFENTAMELYWERFRNIFNLSNLISDENGDDVLEFRLNSPDRWLHDHGYYTPEKC